MYIAVTIVLDMVFTEYHYRQIHHHIPDRISVDELDLPAAIHICRNAVKVTDEEIFVKEPKTRAGNRYVYFSAEMESLLREYRQE